MESTYIFDICLIHGLLRPVLVHVDRVEPEINIFGEIGELLNNRARLAGATRRCPELEYDGCLAVDLGDLFRLQRSKFETQPTALVKASKFSIDVTGILEGNAGRL